MAGQAELDMHARALGFPDYATYAAYQAKQQQGQGLQASMQAQQQAQQQAPQAPQPVQQSEPPNFLQTLLANIHPGFASIFNSSEKYRKAQEHR